ncbi:hypothetical protein G5714_007639 [Onychostoma macrolepis]|uniref:Uncharacterized protein n=1 Tax=Onychostoma macrolepis TaxID=369639 RepID=A0A7J6CTE2_9TELE|nr:hypothetical protein G5714_007639 [Onychostoma macrolepis]
MSFKPQLSNPEVTVEPKLQQLLITDELNKLSAVLAVIDLLLYLCDLMSAVVSYKMIGEALVMIIFSALQLCVTISFSSLTLKELFKRNSVEDPQLYNQVKDVTVSHI